MKYKFGMPFSAQGHAAMLSVSLSLICMAVTPDRASAQAKSCYDQWYDMRVKEMQGAMPRGGLRPSAGSREDIATCEASKDKKFRRIKSLRERG